MKTVLVKSLNLLIPFLFCLTLVPSGVRAASYTFETFDYQTQATGDTYAMGINDSRDAEGLHIRLVRLFYEIFQRYIYVY